MLIADNHMIVRVGLKYILSGEFSGSEFSEVTNSAEFLKLALKNKWDIIIIMDITLPGLKGLEVLRILQDHKIKTPVMVLSYH